jgi:hypothetical protein
MFQIVKETVYGMNLPGIMPPSGTVCSRERAVHERALTARALMGADPADPVDLNMR